MKIAKYDIETENIKSNVNVPEKDFLANELIKLYELARKNAKKGTMTSCSFACGLVDEKNNVYTGVNFNNTRNETSSICAERLAIVHAFINNVENYETGNIFSYKIKYILMSSYTGEGIFWSDKITPCTDCLSWFNSDPRIMSDTKIIWLKKDQNGEICLEVKELSDFLPSRNLKYETAINPSKIIKSKNALNTAIKDEIIFELYERAYFEYKNNTLSKTSKQNIASSILVNNEIFTGKKVDFSKRWYVEPSMAAFYKAVEKFGADTKVQAVCYIGDEYTITENGQYVHEGLISIKTLGRLNTKFAPDDTLVITGISKDTLRVYTIEDYLPSSTKFIQAYKIK